MGKNMIIQQTYGELVAFDQTGEFFFTKGIKAFHRNDFYKAKKYLERATQSDPTQPDYLCQLAIVLSEIGDYKEANELLLTIIEKLEPEFEDCYYFLANNYAHQGLFQEAKKYAHEYLSLAPQGEYVEDTNDLLDLLNIDIDDDAFGFFHTEDELLMKQEEATEFLENGDFKAAALLFQEIIEEYPEFWTAYNNLALAYFYEGKEDKAVELVHSVLKKNNGNLHACCNLAIFYHYMGLEEKAEAMYIQLEKVVPVDNDHRYKLGATFSILGKYEKAYFWLKNLYKRHYDGNATFYYWLSIAAHHCDKEIFSKKMWDRVIQLNPKKTGLEPWNRQ